MCTYGNLNYWNGFTNYSRFLEAKKKKSFLHSLWVQTKFFIAFMCIPQIAHFSDIYWEHYGTGRKVPPTGESTLKAIMFPATRPLVRRSYLAFEVYTMCSKKCNFSLKLKHFLSFNTGKILSFINLLFSKLCI